MSHLQILSSVEQVAAHLRKELISGQRVGTMPGVLRLEAELGVNRNTVEGGLRLLETEGLLESQGRGRRRRIVLPEGGPDARRLRVAIPNYNSEGEAYHFRLRQLLSDAGHEVLMPDRPLQTSRMGVTRLARLVEDTAADAFVVISGFRDELEWLAERPEPVFALFGARGGLPIAGGGPDHVPAILSAVRRLVSLGHSRIVLLVRKALRPSPLGNFSTSFLEELEAHGIATGRYNLPEWQETPEGLRECLDLLFMGSPPSALIIDEPFLFAAAQQHLTRRGFNAPDQVSLVCIDPDPTFEWFHPSVAHLAWDRDQVLKRVIRWANNVASGKDDRRQSFAKAKFVDGGTVGRAPK